MLCLTNQMLSGWTQSSSVRVVGMFVYPYAPRLPDASVHTHSRSTDNDVLDVIALAHHHVGEFDLLGGMVFLNPPPDRLEDVLQIVFPAHQSGQVKSTAAGYR